MFFQLFRRSSNRRSTTPSRNARGLRLESLEGRAMMAADVLSAGFHGGAFHMDSTLFHTSTNPSLFSKTGLFSQQTSGGADGGLRGFGLGSVTITPITPNSGATPNGSGDPVENARVLLDNTLGAGDPDHDSGSGGMIRLDGDGSVVITQHGPYTGDNPVEDAKVLLSNLPGTKDPNDPGTPNDPDAPSDPSFPLDPGFPDDPGNPSDPGSSPENPSNPETPSSPSDPDNGGGGGGGSNGGGDGGGDNGGGDNGGGDNGGGDDGGGDGGDDGMPNPESNGNGNPRADNWDNGDGNDGNSTLRLGNHGISYGSALKINRGVFDPPMFNQMAISASMRGAADLAARDFVFASGNFFH